ncbi:hypothetical protein DICVIV_05121 [Dictyocaulus viviparus]|uniref:Uncharacterized protein n=1 Tax=Dictyocaulus viviparus TaxID=29172 RepID=A0A0D8Y2J9_DICVI|nr:hypothetical protein DICVIV_05121 [Dictyocaulus viviparus]
MRIGRDNHTSILHPSFHYKWFLYGLSKNPYMTVQKYGTSSMVRKLIQYGEAISHRKVARRRAFGSRTVIITPCACSILLNLPLYRNLI